jgi:hypothetical protein
MLEHGNIYKKKGSWVKKDNTKPFVFTPILIFHFLNVHDITIVSKNIIFIC